MKKILSLVSILSIALVSAYATPVSQTEAQKTASTYFAGNSVKLVLSEAQTKSSLAPAYYAFNNPAGGWVIIAGDDCCEPILACSKTGKIDTNNLPANFVSWMNGISKNVNKVRKAGLAPSESVKAKWAGVGTTKATETQTLLTTASWGQDSPYNSKCPSSSLTGCVATAMAIVIKYNQHPTQGTGTIPAYTTETNSYKVPAITLGATYNYSNMPNVYTSSATSVQKEAVATLMYHCGAMVQMDYTSTSSGAYSEDIIPALTTYMGYSKKACELYRYNYSNTDWFRIIKGEIDANRPLIYGGMDSESQDGHQFVLDGYNSNNMVHINWGWDGELNAWYAVNYLGDTSSSGVNDVFSYSDSAIIGLVPDDGTSTLQAELTLEAQPDDNIYGISLASGTIAKGSTFAIDLGFICNYDCNNAYSGSVKVGLYDKDGKLKEYVSAEKSISVSQATISGYYVNPGYTSISALSCKITADIALGDYLMAVYKRTDGEWMILGGYSSDEQTVAYDSSYEFYTMYRLGAIDLAYLSVPQTVTSGQVIYFDLVGSHRLPETIVWYWDGTKNTNRFVKATAGKHTLKAAITYVDGTTETVQRVFNVQ